MTRTEAMRGSHIALALAVLFCAVFLGGLVVGGRLAPPPPDLLLSLNRTNVDFNEARGLAIEARNELNFIGRHFVDDNTLTLTYVLNAEGCHRDDLKGVQSPLGQNFRVVGLLCPVPVRYANGTTESHDIRIALWLGCSSESLGNGIDGCGPMAGARAMS